MKGLLSALISDRWPLSGEGIARHDGAWERAGLPSIASTRPHCARLYLVTGPLFQTVGSRDAISEAISKKPLNGSVACCC